MNAPTDPGLELLRMVVELAPELPPGTLKALTLALKAGSGQNLGRFAATHALRQKLQRLGELHDRQSDINAAALAFALQGAAEAAAVVTRDQRVEIAWT